MRTINDQYPWNTKGSSDGYEGIAVYEFIMHPPLAI